ncbi:type II toxin-antitoxin system RelE/ParE family toxin [Alcanivorax sp. S71-1-4]|uniref:type II toxin-antitoxin system RelE/ParE family toxin n=1 Tax=Alcanivorax sp. S71-1-4 TaxID=1177159 RepID=UPI00135798AC|nr:type II toxin-antitoxin system RelE/ParE family toxin [Alcanivorax sp. S71-1-4]
MIVSFRCRETRRLAAGQSVPRFSAVARVVLRKLRQLQIASELSDLRVPPGNRLESLYGDRAGCYSIRVNDQFRLCFRWTPLGPAEVEIVDYH